MAVDALAVGVGYLGVMVATALWARPLARRSRSRGLLWTVIWILAVLAAVGGGPP